MADKIITFKLIGPNGFIIGTDPIRLLQYTFGCIKDGSVIDPQLKEELFDNLETDEFFEYKIVVEKRYTEKQLAKMAESDGDIH